MTQDLYNSANARLKRVRYRGNPDGSPREPMPKRAIAEDWQARICVHYLTPGAWCDICGKRKDVLVLGPDGWRPEVLIDPSPLDPLIAEGWRAIEAGHGLTNGQLVRWMGELERLAKAG